MENIKEHFEKEAKKFDEIIIKLIPYYEQMVDSLVSCIPFNDNAQIKVIDLGCGTGTIAKKISDRFKNSTIACLDIAANMIEMAQLKLAGHPKTEFINVDFSKIDFTEKFDVVVSSLALHHLETDKQKKDFYRRIFDNLKTNGIFVNADVVLGSSDYWQDLNMQKWIDYMNHSVSMEEIQNNWIPKYKSEDRPAILIDQIQWLKEIGFKKVDVIWKYFNFSVYGAIK